jgi:hypothetical protein
MILDTKEQIELYRKVKGKILDPPQGYVPDWWEKLAGERNCLAIASDIISSVRGSYDRDPILTEIDKFLIKYKLIHWQFREQTAEMDEIIRKFLIAVFRMTKG